jgi:predicted MFS family arabinose efflux permease
VTTPALIGPVLGPPVGGFITTFSSWRWIFFLNVPIGIIGLALVTAFMVNQKAEEQRSFDWMGFVLSGTGLAALLFGLDQLGRPSIGIAFTTTLIAVGVAICAAAYVHLRRTEHPLLDLTLFRIPTFSITTLFGGTGFRIVIGTTPFLWPLLLQVGFGMSAFASGSVIIACAIGDFGMKFFSKRILARFGFRQTLFVNGILVALAVLSCAALGPSTPVAVIVVVFFLVGVFRSIQFGSFNALTYGDVTPDRMSAASSLAGTIQQMSFGLGVAFAALALHLAALADRNAAGGFTVGDFRLAFVITAALALHSAFAFRRLAPDAGAETSGHRLAEPVSPAALAG